MFAGKLNKKQGLNYIHNQSKKHFLKINPLVMKLKFFIGEQITKEIHRHRTQVDG
jgi:hypothetical protein